VLDYFMTEVNAEANQPHTDVITHQRDAVLFDFLGRGLALTHRPFDAVELGRGRLDAAQTPVLWAMLEQQLDAATQQKLVDYLHQGGRLVIAGRLPVADFDGRPCTVLQDALGVQAITNDPPFVTVEINAFDYQNIPASFVETYTGDLGEVFARRQSGEAVGFIKAVGQGRVLVFGAAMGTWTLDDLAVLDTMAQTMGCPRAFGLSEWADVRLSRGERGSFLYVSNYLDDAIETHIAFEGQNLFGGHSVRLPARQGAILPIGWQVRPGVTVNYATAEVNEVVETDAGLTLRTAQPEFVAELTLDGYQAEGATAAESGQVRLLAKAGEIVLRLTEKG
jgi:beta-galactosidase